ncbi:MAG: hypothetical protein EXR92_06830 [Gemmatimonadetes bacterium]|nr:hypothetical protein [Gemmatimonadota bacterium]
MTPQRVGMPDLGPILEIALLALAGGIGWEMVAAPEIVVPGTVEVALLLIVTALLLRLERNLLLRLL